MTKKEIIATANMTCNYLIQIRIESICLKEGVTFSKVAQEIKDYHPTAKISHLVSLFQ